MSEVVSVRRIREEANGDDFDIFEDGSFRERTRLQGAGTWMLDHASRGKIENILVNCVGIGKHRLLGENFLLNESASSRVSSRCWVWSSPTGTCVALQVKN